MRVLSLVQRVGQAGKALPMLDGRADESMSDLYDKIGEDDAFRLERAEKCPIGFLLPSAVPSAPKDHEHNLRTQAA